MITVQITYNDGDNVVDITKSQPYEFEGTTKMQTVQVTSELTRQALNSFKAAVLV